MNHKGAFTLTENETDKNGLYRFVWRRWYCTEILMPLGTVAIYPPLSRSRSLLVWTHRNTRKNTILCLSSNNNTINNSAMENNNSLILTHKFYFDKVWNSNILQENSIFCCCSELEPDVTWGGGVEGWELNGGIGLPERHHVVKHICNGNPKCMMENKSSEFMFYH